MTGSRPLFPLSPNETALFARDALAEDVGPGDVTCAAVIPAAARLEAVMAAREAMTVCGLALAEAMFKALDANAAVDLQAADGDDVEPGAVLLTVRGQARALLTAERTALNIVQHLSGIATLARRYTDTVAGTGTVVLDTRKTIPRLRRLAKYATACGGVCNHRMGLYDAVMIKDNHIAVAGSVANAVAAAKKAGQSDIQVECDTLDQVEEAIAAGAASLLLDNMDLATLERAVAMVGGRVRTEASGGVTLETVRIVAETGVDAVSVGRLTQSAAAVDIGLDFSGAP